MILSFVIAIENRCLHFTDNLLCIKADIYTLAIWVQLLAIEHQANTDIAVKFEQVPELLTARQQNKAKTLSIEN